MDIFGGMTGLQILWIFLASLVSAFPAAFIAFYLTLKMTLKRQILDLPKMLSDPAMQYQFKLACNMAAEINAEARQKQSAELAAQLVEIQKKELAALLEVGLNQFAEHQEKVLKGLMGSFSNNMSNKLLGQGEGGSRLGLLGELLDSFQKQKSPSSSAPNNSVSFIQ